MPSAVGASAPTLRGPPDGAPAPAPPPVPSAPEPERVRAEPGDSIDTRSDLSAASSASGPVDLARLDPLAQVGEEGVGGPHADVGPDEGLLEVVPRGGVDLAPAERTAPR